MFLLMCGEDRTYMSTYQPLQDINVCELFKKERNRLNLSQKEIADFLGMSSKQISRWETQIAIPSDKLALLSGLGFDTNYIITGINNDSLPVAALPTQSTALQTSHADLTAVPQYDLAASAGGGALVIAEHPIARFELSTRWLQQNNLHNKTLTVVPVRGDSMEHTLYDGDLTLVSLIDDPIDAREGVCVLRFDDEIFVKRIQYDFKSKGYNITSDNSAYSGFFVDADDINAGRFSVLGRVERVLQRARKVD
ncbi:LexA family transcriptional regulator [Pseudoalteromonas neustonica]|uniref:LexA family transcriptional regulator n=2 Tax=Pseudoalteromonas neustonica TaxID=1840331 RepID=A0ABY3FIE1_9GAMM|nr:LexA family transcriptional regulator [Pseudoalteromonas neustonica]